MIYGCNTVLVRCACGKEREFPAIFPIVFRCDCADTIGTYVATEATDAQMPSAEAKSAG